MKKSKLLFEGASWDEDTIDRIWVAGRKLATEKYGLEFYEPRFEIVSYEQMLDNYSTSGMPNMYDHWSFGKQRIKDEQEYKKGQKGLAYEMVLNTNPSICYLMEDNTALMQCLVILHAAIGHSSFFKTNRYFLEHTDADNIVEDLYEYKTYIQACEEEYGEAQVSLWLSFANSLENWGFDTIPPAKSRSNADKLRRRRELVENYNKQNNELYGMIPGYNGKQRIKLVDDLADLHNDMNLPCENILRFIAENSREMEPWQRDIFGIIADINQYFYPQRITGLMNEGFASFWHYTLINDFYDMGYINEGHMIEFMASHSGVLYQPPHNSQYYSGLNVYALGFDMFSELRRSCESPTDLDREVLPMYAGTDWVKTVKEVAADFKNETFVQQCLHPNTAKKMGLFSVCYDNDDSQKIISGIQTIEDFNSVKRTLAKQYNLRYTIPRIEIAEANTHNGLIESVVVNVIIEEDGVDIKSNNEEHSAFFELENGLDALLGCEVEVNKVYVE